MASTAPSTITGSKAGITVAVMCAALMAMLDISIVNVALTDIRASFGTPLDQIGWVSTGYMMANVVVIPMTGWLQRRFGYRRYFAGSILLFTLASALCGTAWNLPSLVAFRVLQGVGGGAIIPTAQSILFARYPREEHGMAGGIFGLGAVTGPLLGPTVGGWLIDVSSWHWIFLVNLPVGILAAALAWRFIEEPGYQRPDVPVDTFGIGLLAVGMASLQYVLEEGNREGWDSTEILILATVAAIALVTFFVHELETAHPVVDLRVFANRSYSAGTRDQLPPRHRALLRVVPVLALLRRGDALHGARHRQDLPGRRRHPDRAHAAARQVLRQGRRPRARRLRHRHGVPQPVDERSPHQPGQLLGSGQAADGAGVRAWGSSSSRCR